MESFQFKMMAPAKINYILEIGARRKDGYHEIVTVFQTISLQDTLHFKEMPREIKITTDSPELEDVEKNLVFKAADTLKRMLQINKGAHIHLEKTIPIGAGLGGGSSDAATTLKGLSRLWGLKLSEDQYLKFASKIGSDVPFFVGGGVAVGRGRGEKISHVSRGITPKLQILVVKPDIVISSAESYKQWDESRLTPDRTGIDKFMNALFRRDYRVMLTQVHNDFEKLILPRHPSIASIKESMIRSGAIISLLCGSGSAVFGVFEDDDSLEKASAELSEAGQVFKVTTI